MRISRRGGVQAPGSCDRSLETNQQTKQTKTTSRCKIWPEYGNGSTAWYLDGWGEFQKDLYQAERKRGRHPPAFLRHMGSGRHAETGCRRVYTGEVFEWQKNSMEAGEMFGDSGGRNYANSQFSNQTRQDAISRMSAVRNRVAWSERTDGLAAETHGHIKCAGCEGMATTVTAAHHSI